MLSMTDVKYVVSINKSKTDGYQRKKGKKGSVIAYISNLWSFSDNFEDFVFKLIHIFIHERICLERGFNRIRIKGGMCNPCCVRKTAKRVYDLCFGKIPEECVNV